MTQANEPGSSASTVGSRYPKNYVVGVIDDLQEAKQARQAFKDAGYDTEEIRLMESGEMVQKTQDIEEHKNWLQRFLSSFQSTMVETGKDIYEHEAQEGHQILHVHANTEEDVDKISKIMMQYHAHAIKFFGTWNVADVTPDSVS